MAPEMVSLDEVGEILGEEGVLGVITGRAGVEPAVVVLGEETAAEAIGQRLVPLTTMGRWPGTSAMGGPAADGAVSVTVTASMMLTQWGTNQASGRTD